MIGILNVPCILQVQQSPVEPRNPQLIHIPRCQSQRNRPRQIHSRILKLPINKQRHRNQPAGLGFSHIAGPLIHPHRPHHLLRRRFDLVHLRPDRHPYQHRKSNHRAKYPLSHSQYPIRRDPSPKVLIRNRSRTHAIEPHLSPPSPGTQTVLLWTNKSVLGQ